MGNVSARDKPYGNGVQSEENEVDGDVLNGVQARVKRVHIDGLDRTREDVVWASVEPLMKVQQFTQLLLAAQEARARLQGLGCFTDVDIQIDTSPDGDRSDYEVTFAVREVRRLMGSINTMVGNQEGSINFGLKLPNLYGRGESLQADYSHGSKKTNQCNLSLVTPIWSFRPELPLLATLTSSIYQQASESIPSGYREVNRGCLADIAFQSAPQVAHNLQFEAVWRELSCLNKAVAFAVREHCGHTLKTGVRHILTVDRRDNPIFPEEGSLLRLIHEFAGGYGDIGFFKGEVEVQANVPLYVDLPMFRGGDVPFVLQSTFHCGLLKRHQSRNNDKTLTLADRFYLGGPLNVRGFEMRGLGPVSEGNAVGGLLYWATGLHLYAPLPFRNPASPSGFGDLFRTHAFITAGNLMSDLRLSSSSSRDLEELVQNFRLSYGVGLAMKLGGIARLELNYCVPFKVQAGDRICPGLQLGVGVNFL